MTDEYAPTHQTLDDLRMLIEPESFVQSIKRTQGLLKNQMADLFVDLDMLVDNPNLNSEAVELQKNRFEELIRDAAWRLAECDRRLKAYDEAKDSVRRPIPLSEFRAVPKTE